MKKNKDQINSFLGKDTEFEGKLSFTGAIRIDGVFGGEIFTKGTLIVGEKAIIKSEIHTSRIIISGEVHGNIVAENSVIIYAPGKVFGNIQSPILRIDEGVIFEGNCQMQKQSEALEKKVSVLPK